MYQVNQCACVTASVGTRLLATLPCAAAVLLALSLAVPPARAGATTALSAAPERSTATTRPAAPATGVSIQGGLPVSGVVNVGSGELITSLTNPGGMFEAINNSTLGGDITVQITSDLTGETGAVALEQFAEAGLGGYTLTIKPAGAPRVVSGAGTALLVLNGTDRVVIDGSLDGGSDRSLTLVNSQGSAATVVQIASGGVDNGANDNVIRNCIIRGTSSADVQTTVAIVSGAGGLGSAAEAPNNNNTIQNNWMFSAENALYLRGGEAPAAFDEGWQILDNEMGSAVDGERNRFRGMLIGSARDFVIRGNHIHGIHSSPATGAAMSGIQLAFSLDGGVIEANTIHDIRNHSASGTGAAGLNIGTASVNSNVLVANNFIHDVAAMGSAQAVSNGMGIVVRSGGGYLILHNSVQMTTAQPSGVTAAMMVLSVVEPGGLDLRNNILANTAPAGATRYAVHSQAPANVFGAIDHNDYFAPDAIGYLGEVQLTLAEWRNATGQDQASLAVNPLFTSATDLHLQDGSPMVNAGTPIAGVDADIDGDSRLPSTPDIGADELVLPEALFKDGFE